MGVIFLGLFFLWGSEGGDPPFLMNFFYQKLQNLKKVKVKKNWEHPRARSGCNARFPAGGWNPPPVGDRVKSKKKSILINE